jgi:hypothetical protein
MIDYEIKILFTKRFRISDSGIETTGFIQKSTYKWSEIVLAGVQLSSSKSNEQTLKQMGEMFTAFFENILRTREAMRFILFTMKDGTLVHLHVPEEHFEQVAALFSQFLQDRFTEKPQEYFELRKKLGKRVDPIFFLLSVIFIISISLVFLLVWATLQALLRQ